MHESIKKKHNVKIGSDRSFGLVFAGIFTALATYIYFVNNSQSARYVFVVGLIFFILALLVPNLLKPLNFVWFKFGQLLHKIISPVIMGLVFYLAVTPTALIMRATRKDLLRLKRQPDANSYWIERDPPGPAPDSMKKQF